MMDTATYARDTCPHRLPTGGGHSVAWKYENGQRVGQPSVTVWCGRCHRIIDAHGDMDWDTRYQRSHGYSPHARLAMSDEDALADEERRRLQAQVNHARREAARLGVTL